MARSSYAASVELRKARLFRSSVSRAYFAAFAAVTARLDEQGVRFTSDFEGPSHSAVQRLAESNLTGLRKWQKRDLQNLINVLRNSRIQADYRPSFAVGLPEARQALQDAGTVLSMLEVPRE